MKSAPWVILWFPNNWISGHPQRLRHPAEGRLYGHGTEINKMTTYRDMYAQIGRKIVAGSPGDSRQSIVSSASLVLDLEEALRNRNPDLGN
jgi:hypothetical protein